MTAWVVSVSFDSEVAGSILGICNLENFLCVLGVELDSPSPVTIGWQLDWEVADLIK